MMAYIYPVTSLLLDAWFYSLFHGVYHALIALFVMLFCCIFFLRMSIVPSVFLCVFVSVCAPVLYGCVVILLGDSITIPYVSTPQELIPPLSIGLLLGVVYATVQTMLFWILSFWYTLSLGRLAIVSYVSNALAALVIAYFSPIM